MESQAWDSVKFLNLNKPSQSFYHLIDNFLGKDYQDFRDFYTEFIENKQGRTIIVGTFDELTKEAMDRADRHLMYKQRAMWKKVAYKKNRFYKGNFYYADVYDICNDLAPTDLGLYKAIHPITEKDISVLKLGIYHYLNNIYCKDEIHVIGRAKTLLISNYPLKEIAHNTHLDYDVLSEVRNSLRNSFNCKTPKGKAKDIKDLSRKAISSLNDYCSQLLTKELHYLQLLAKKQQQ